MLGTKIMTGRPLALHLNQDYISGLGGIRQNSDQEVEAGLVEHEQCWLLQGAAHLTHYFIPSLLPGCDFIGRCDVGGLRCAAEQDARHSGYLVRWQRGAHRSGHFRVLEPPLPAGARAAPSALLRLLD